MLELVIINPRFVIAQCLPGELYNYICRFYDTSFFQKNGMQLITPEEGVTTGDGVHLMNHSGIQEQERDGIIIRDGTIIISKGNISLESTAV